MPTNSIKDQILEQVVAYYRSEHSGDGPFIPGETRIHYAGRQFDEHELVNLVDAALEFWLTYGRYSKQFEANLSRFLGTKFCSLVNTGSSANLLAFMALTSPRLEDRRIQRGDEVITVAAGFPTTVAPIVQYGAIPVFVDIDIQSLNVNADQLDRALSAKTKAVFLAHTLGNPFDVDGVTSFCDKNGLWLVEDNCDALGSTYRGKHTGTFGHIGTSSFYPPHHITMGEGGAAYTNDALLHQIMNSLRDWGRDCWCESGVDNTCGKRFSQQFGSLPKGYDHKYVYSHFGYNLKATDMQAAIGVAQLEKLPGFIRHRRENFSVLYDHLKGLDDYFILPEATPHSQPSWFGFWLTVRGDAGFERNDLSSHLEKHNIQTRNLFAGNLTRHPAFEVLQEGKDYRVVGSLDMTDTAMRNTLWVGVYPGMKRPFLDYIADTIKDFIP